MPPDCTAFMRN